MNIDEQLAELLGQYPAIWNKKCSSYRDNTKKANSFKELALKLNASVEFITTRYKALREKYRKEKIKINTTSRSGASQQEFEPWALMQTLSFLDSVQIKRKTATNVSESEISMFVAENEQNDDTFSPSEMYSHVTDEDTWEVEVLQSDTIITKPTDAIIMKSPPNSGRNTPLVKRPRCSKPDNVDVLVGRLVSAAEATSNAVKPQNSKPHDMLETFGKFVGESLNSISEDYRDDAILEIQQILHKFKKKM